MSNEPHKICAIYNIVKFCLIYHFVFLSYHYAFLNAGIFHYFYINYFRTFFHLFHPFQTFKRETLKLTNMKAATFQSHDPLLIEGLKRKSLCGVFTWKMISLFVLLWKDNLEVIKHQRSHIFFQWHFIPRIWTC